ncbi:TPA: hypothetical protein N0F65_007609 [Lagenidium giganteum]|uniref:HMG box domain-containing protein n=1 Tax=Lagenidium giganteum TaxID=4803 RepID=A0AAV2ZLX8_9STRA|nr:TPA: hypothetical protein N0F65_007609 [Lagenidium giganteum]
MTQSATIMGKKPSGGVNTKVEAANARKASAKAAKDSKKAAEEAAVEAADWAKGSNDRGERRRQEEERKRAEAEAKKNEKKMMLALEEHAMAKVEDKGAIRKSKTKDKKELNKPWEEALKPALKKNNKGSRAPPPAPAPTKVTQQMIQERMEEEARKNKKAGKSEIQFDTNFSENRNRQLDVEGEARGIEAAIDLLSMDSNDPTERHPERRAKAAYKAFEEATMPQLKEDYPGLKLSQYKQKLSEMWRKSPQNPLNQESLAYNAKK